MRSAFLLCAILACALRAAVPALAADAPVPIAAFFDHLGLSGARLSPDGKRLAMRVNNRNGHDQLGVVNLADLSIKVVASFSDDDVGRFEWVNNDRLLYDSRDKHAAPGRNTSRRGCLP